MSYLAQQAAWPIALDPSPKAVLTCLAWHACNSCGLAWPGVQCLSTETGLGKTAVREALEVLKVGGHLRVNRFEHGGRALSTEYVVMPALRWKSTAPCGECRLRMKNPPAGGAFSGKATGKATAQEGLKAPPGGDHQSTTIQQSGGEPASEPAAASPDGLGVEPNPPGSRFPDPPPQAPQTAAQVKAYVDALSSKLHLRTPPGTKPGSHTGP